MWMSRVGASNSATSCDLLIFVEDAAEPVVSLDLVNLGRHAVGERSRWSGLLQSAVRPVIVVVTFELAQHDRGVSLVENQESVEELAADCSDEALGDRVRLWCPHRRPDALDVGGAEDGVEGGGELAVMQEIITGGLGADALAGVADSLVVAGLDDEILRFGARHAFDRWPYSSEPPHDDLGWDTGRAGRNLRETLLQQLADRVGFQNSATAADLRFQAARSYSLISPPRIGRRLICG